MRGLLWLFAFLALTALKAVVIGHMFNVKTVGPVVLLFWTFLLVSIWFTLFRSRQPGENRGFWPRLIGSWGSLLGLQVTTVAAWFGYYGSLACGLEPAIYGAVAYTGQPAWTLLVMQFVPTGPKTTRRDVLIGAGIVFGMSVLTVGSFVGWSAAGEMPTMQVATAIGLAALSGVGMAGNAVFATRLSKSLSPSEVLSSRFVLLVVTAGLLTPTVNLLPANTDAWVLIVVVASVGVAVPLYCYQRGVAALQDPHLVAISLSCLPVLQLVFQLFDPHLRASLCSWAGVIVTASFAAYGIFLRRTPKTPQPTPVQEQVCTSTR
jgi:drug/metabolite transporter (DMT)-like permease